MEEWLNAVSAAGHSWLTPFISSDEDSYITVEGYGEKLQLHLEIEEDVVEYIQVWGTDIKTEMHVATLCSNGYLTLWNWLLDG